MANSITKLRSMNVESFRVSECKIYHLGSELLLFVVRMAHQNQLYLELLPKFLVFLVTIPKILRSCWGPIGHLQVIALNHYLVSTLGFQVNLMRLAGWKCK